jgi:hypothetical protein
MSERTRIIPRTFGGHRSSILIWRRPAGFFFLWGQTRLCMWAVGFEIIPRGVMICVGPFGVAVGFEPWGACDD